MDWPILPDEADEIPDELALRVGRATLADHLLIRRWTRAIEEGGKHSQDALDLGSAMVDAGAANTQTLLMALEVLDDGT